MPDRSRPQPLYRDVADGIRRRIRNGDYGPGQALPTIRELAATWSVSVFTVQKALDVLSLEGLIITKPRAMTLVAGPRRNGKRTSTDAALTMREMRGRAPRRDPRVLHQA